MAVLLTPRSPRNESNLSPILALDFGGQNKIGYPYLYYWYPLFNGLKGEPAMMSKNKTVILLYPIPPYLTLNAKYQERVKKCCREEQLSVSRIIRATGCQDYKALHDLRDTVTQEEITDIVIDRKLLNYPEYIDVWFTLGGADWFKDVKIHYFYSADKNRNRDFIFRNTNFDYLEQNRADLVEKALVVLSHLMSVFNRNVPAPAANELCLLQVISPEDEKTVFREAEEILKSLTMPVSLRKAVIGSIKATVKLERKQGNGDYLGYLKAVEKSPHNFEIGKVFSYVPAEEKYRIINSVFSRLEIRNGKPYFTLRQRLNP